MGSSLNPDDIKEGDDVYFECSIKANPKTYRLAWFHDVSNDTINRTAYFLSWFKLPIILSSYLLYLSTILTIFSG